MHSYYTFLSVDQEYVLLSDYKLEQFPSGTVGKTPLASLVSYNPTTLV